MIQLIKHRCNKIQDLETCESQWGVEIDLRSDVNNPVDLHLAHDPFSKGESFKKWLAAFAEKSLKGPIILNTKEDSLESLTLELIKEIGITNDCIFLDTTIPTLKRWTRQEKRRHFFIRWSTLEPLNFCEQQAGFCDWAWVDCFDRVVPPPEVISQLSGQFKTCLVSPELQGGSIEDIQKFLPLIKSGLSAICTKHPQHWARLIESPL